MGPFPHDAPPSEITADNPAGTDGFEFVEFAHPEPEKLRELFTRMGYIPVAKHKTKDITVWRQGDINYLLNAGGIFDVATERQRLYAKFLQFFGSLLAALLLPSAQHEVSAHFSEALSHLAAQPDGAASYDGDPAGQVKELFRVGSHKSSLVAALPARVVPRRDCT